MSKGRLIVDFVSDFICPWCYIGLASLAHAKSLLSDDHEVVLRFRPYELDPDIPPGGVDRAERMARKFPDKGALDAIRKHLAAAAEDVGLSFDPARPARVPQTIKAHLLLREAMRDDLQEAMAAALFRAYWIDGADIENLDVLIGIAETAGVPAGKDIWSDAALRDVKAEAASFRRAGVAGVPTFIVNERVGFSGALAPGKLNAALLEAAGRGLQA